MKPYRSRMLRVERSKVSSAVCVSYLRQFLGQLNLVAISKLYIAPNGGWSDRVVGINSKYTETIELTPTSNMPIRSGI